MRGGWRHLFTNWRNLGALTLVGLFTLLAAAAPLLAPGDDPLYPPSFKLVESLDRDPLPPGPEAPLGTAAYYQSPEMLLHFDILHSLIWGTRDALRFGLLTALTTACLGLLIGAFSGYVEGWVHSLAMRITDAFLSFPMITGIWLFSRLMASLDQYILLPGFQYGSPPPTPLQRLILTLGVDPIMLALILFSWMAYARIISANVILLKQAEYVQAARSVGAGPLRIILRHILPNAITPALVLVARDIGRMVVLEAAFTFIGLGGSVTSPVGTGSGKISEWSRLLLLGRHRIIGEGGNPFVYWWVYLPATLALVLFGVSWNLLGDRLNTLLNPREAD
jgi:peptide/nickel transport system permease protein